MTSDSFEQPTMTCPRADCHHSEESFVRGYDQAAREVMSEVKRRDPTLYRSIVLKYPTWQLGT